MLNVTLRIQELWESQPMSVQFGVFVLGLVLLVIVINFISKKIILHYVNILAKKTATQMDDILIKNKVFDYVAHIVPGILIYAFAHFLEREKTVELTQRLAVAYIIIIMAVATFKVFNAVVEYTKMKSPSKAGPIKGVLQVAKIVVIIFSVLIIIVNFLGNETAFAIVGSIGGMSAVLLLVFRDSILGLVAGIQLSSEGLLKLGDWLEMPKYNADGEVVDISLTKITVRNWDKTYTSIPAYKFIEDSFKNWQGMSDAGGRRIKRSINIDMNSVGFLSQDQIDDLYQIEILKPYIKEKLDEIAKYNKNATSKHAANIRQLTNVGTFRAYILSYLKNNPNIRKDFTLLVRQLPPTEKGLPMEIYCFSSDTAWANYEGIQSDIFDHLLAIITTFGLRVYQEPSGYDLRSLDLRENN